MEVEASGFAVCKPDLYTTPSKQMTTLEILTPQDVEKTEVSTPVACPVSFPVNDENVRLSVKNSNEDESKTSELKQPPTTQPPVVPNSNVGKYRLIRTIGKGNFAKVKLAIHLVTGAEVAIKIINKTVMDSTLLKRLKREITIMKITNHPHIVRLLEIIENEDVLCLVMEYASGGEIFDYLVANGKMREKEARIKFRQLLSAIQYCHAKRIVHRDLKAENILLDGNLNVKVADFGLANTFEHEQRLNTFCGSPPYAAPELFLGIPYYGPGVDIWSLGVILFALVLGHLPFDAHDLRELRSKIIGLNYSIPKGSVSPECEALLRKMLVLDPKDRSSLKNLMQDKWINMGFTPQDILKPYKEPPKGHVDEVRVRAMEAMGITKAALESSVVNPEFDHIYATYHLLPETPSQFVAICDDLATRAPEAKARNSIILPKPLLETHSNKSTGRPSVVPTPSTAVGRFTVVPSANTEPRPTEATPHANHSPTSSSSGKPPSTTYPGDAGSREHHSLTSTLPVALKRAFVHMSRTFGANATGTSGTHGHGSETPSRGHTHTNGGRSSTKPMAKPDSERSAITAAPVPILSGKKPSTTTTQSKRSPHVPHHTTAVGQASIKSSISESSSGTNTPTVARPSISGSGKSSANQIAATTRLSPSLRSEPVSRGAVTKISSSPRSSASTSSHAPSRRSPNIRPVADVDSSHGRATPANKSPTTEKPIPSSTDGPVPLDDKSLTSSSSTSSSSYNETPIRRKSASSMQDVWLGTGSAEPHSPVDRHTPLSDSSEPVKLPTPVPHTSMTPPLPGQKVPGKATSSWSEREFDKSASPPMAPVGRTMNAHTVQGAPLGSLRGGATRASDAACTVGLGRGGPEVGNYAVDGAHVNTWSRGVFKAFGGLFTPSAKPNENRPISSITSGSILGGPREVRFPWSVHTTSTKSAEEVLQNIIAAIEVTPGCRFAYDQHLPFMLRCSWASDRDAIRAVNSGAAAPGTTTTTDPEPPPQAHPTHFGLRDDPVHWEMEVCQLPRLHLRGVRLKRIRGSALQFRPLADLVMKSLHL